MNFFFHAGGLVILLFATVQCQREGSGLYSGSGSGEQPDFVDAGSGDSTADTTTAGSRRTFNPDDEDNVIISNLGEGSGLEEDSDKISSGDDPDIEFVPVGNEWRCSHSRPYCWCEDKLGEEIPGSKRFMKDSSFELDCNSFRYVSVLQARPPTTKTPGTIMLFEKTTAKRSTPHKDSTLKFTSSPPGVSSSIADGSPKHRLENPVQRKKVIPLFTHPGILAAVIGGGVVALLCGILLIMFVFYRMRKKDEGSYPLDPDAKPPRLHTYTQAPTKEFYA